MKNIVVIVLGIITYKDKILLTKRVDEKEPSANNKWQLPGGGLKFGEHPEDGIVRELKEELGVKTSVIKTLPFIDNRFISTKSGKIIWHGLKLFFLCKPESYKFKLNKEASEWEWFSKKDIKKIKTFDKIEDIFNYL